MMMGEPDEQGVSRKADGTYAKGVSGNPAGRAVGSIDRVKAVEDAICAKSKLEGHDGVVKWLKGLPNSMLARLYARLLPKESHIKATISWEEVVDEAERRAQKLAGSTEKTTRMPQDGRSQG